MQELRDKLEARDRDVLVRDFQLSQLAQSATLVNELRPCANPLTLPAVPTLQQLTLAAVLAASNF